MKKFLYFTALTLIIVMFTSGASFVKAADLPESVQSQSRKDAEETEVWKKFDKSGSVRFLQVQHTAAASEAGTASTLDGSFGERLIEVKVDDSIEGEEIVWMLENKGPGGVWVIAENTGTLEAAIEIPPKASIELETKLKDGYGYIVVDSDGKDETTLSLKGKVGETDAKTVRGKSMSILWF